MEGILGQNQNPPEKWLQTYAEQRSEHAFAQLVQFYSGMVYSSALRRTSDPHLAEEISQDVFTLLARKANQLVDHPSLTGWLHTTTRWVSNDKMKKEETKMCGHS